MNDSFMLFQLRERLLSPKISWHSILHWKSRGKNEGGKFYLVFLFLPVRHCLYPTAFLYAHIFVIVLGNYSLTFFLKKQFHRQVVLSVRKIFLLFNLNISSIIPSHYSFTYPRQHSNWLFYLFGVYILQIFKYKALIKLQNVLKSILLL